MTARGEGTPPEASEHSPWEELAVGHALHALEPADEAAFASHLPTCDSCRRLLAEMHEVAADLAYAADPTDPPASLWQGIAARLDSSDRPPLPAEFRAMESLPVPSAGKARSALEPGGGSADGSYRSAEPAEPGRRPAWLRTTALAVAAGLIVIAGLGGIVLVGRYLQVRSDKAAAERQLAAVLTCAGRTECSVVPLKGQDGSAASAVALVQTGTVQLVVNNLPATDSRSSYVLWAGRPGGPMTGVGRFLISNAGRHIISPDLRSPVTLTAGGVLAVTREPGRAIPAAPSTKPTLLGSPA